MDYRPSFGRALMQYDHLRKLMTDTVTLMLKNGLKYENKFNVNALVVVNIDDRDVFHVVIDDMVQSEYLKAQKQAEEMGKKAADDARKKAEIELETNKRMEEFKRSYEVPQITPQSTPAKEETMASRGEAKFRREGDSWAMKVRGFKYTTYRATTKRTDWRCSNCSQLISTENENGPTGAFKPGRLISEPPQHEHPAGKGVKRPASAAQAPPPKAQKTQRSDQNGGNSEPQPLVIQPIPNEREDFVDNIADFVSNNQLSERSRGRGRGRGRGRRHDDDDYHPEDDLGLPRPEEVKQPRRRGRPRRESTEPTPPPVAPLSPEQLFPPPDINGVIYPTGPCEKMLRKFAKDEMTIPLFEPDDAALRQLIEEHHAEVADDKEYEQLSEELDDVIQKYDGKLGRRFPIKRTQQPQIPCREINEEEELAAAAERREETAVAADGYDQLAARMEEKSAADKEEDKEASASGTEDESAAAEEESAVTDSQGEEEESEPQPFGSAPENNDVTEFGQLTSLQPVDIRPRDDQVGPEMAPLIFQPTPNEQVGHYPASADDSRIHLDYQNMPDLQDQMEYQAANYGLVAPGVLPVVEHNADAFPQPPFQGSLPHSHPAVADDVITQTSTVVSPSLEQHNDAGRPLSYDVIRPPEQQESGSDPPELVPENMNISATSVSSDCQPPDLLPQFAPCGEISDAPPPDMAS